MAGVVKVNGDMGVAGVVHNFIGTKLKFVSMTIKNGSGVAVNMSGEGGVNEAWTAIYNAVSLQATPVLFQYESGSSGVAAWGIEQDGAGWTAATLQAAIRALGTSVGANGVDVSGTEVFDFGLKLAQA